MPTPHSVRYSLGYSIECVNELLEEDIEEHDRKGYESLTLAKKNIILAIQEINKVINDWKGKND